MNITDFIQFANEQGIAPEYDGEVMTVRAPRYHVFISTGTPEMAMPPSEEWLDAMAEQMAEGVEPMEGYWGDDEDDYDARPNRRFYALTAA